jgi:hypothetical protein
VNDPKVPTKTPELTKDQSTRCLKLMPVILAIQEAEIRGITA